MADGWWDRGSVGQYKSTAAAMKATAWEKLTVGATREPGGSAIPNYFWISVIPAVGQPSSSRTIWEWRSTGPGHWQWWW